MVTEGVEGRGAGVAATLPEWVRGVGVLEGSRKREEGLAHKGGGGKAGHGGMHITDCAND